MFLNKLTFYFGAVKQSNLFNVCKMRKVIDQLEGCDVKYRWYDVVLEKALADKLDLEQDEYPVRIDWNSSPPSLAGKVINLRNVNGALVGDIIASCELKGLYPGVCYKVLEQRTSLTGFDLVKGKLLYIGVAAVMNVDTTLEPFI